MNLWWCGEADQSVLSLSQSLAYYPDLIKRCFFYFLSYALNVEYCDWDGRFSQAPKEGRHPWKKYKSVYMGIREERRAGGMTGFHVRKWTSSLHTPAGVGVEGRLTAWLASRNLPCFQRSEKNVIFITIKKCFCTNSVCITVLLSERLAQSQRICSVWCLGRPRSAFHLCDLKTEYKGLGDSYGQ